MRELLKQSLAVLLAVAVVTAGGIGAASYTDRNVSPVGESEAIATITAIGIGVVATGVAYETGILSAEEQVDPAEDEETDQVRSDLYSAALGDAEDAEVIHTAMNNYLNDTATIARMEGKNAFITYLDTVDDPSQAQAEVNATNAVLDYYSQKQITVYQSWAADSRSAYRIIETAKNESNITKGNVVESMNIDSNLNELTSWDDQEDGGPATYDLVNRTDTLANGTDYTYQTLEVTYSYSGGSDTHALDPAGTVIGSGMSYNYDYKYTKVNPSQSQQDAGMEPTRLLEENYTSKHLAIIDDQASNVDSEVSDFSNSTYDAWTADEINSTDLVDPYLGSREYTPDDGETWGMRTLTSLGITPPENVSNLERMTIRDEDTGAEYNGTLMAGADPVNESGYEIGKTYWTENVPGEVFIATDDGPRDLSGNFTITGAKSFDGSANYTDGDVIRFNRPDYQTADLSEFKNLSSQVIKMRAELEALEQKKEGAAGGSGLLSGIGLGAGSGTVVLLVAGGVVLLMMQNNGPGGRPRRRRN